MRRKKAGRRPPDSGISVVWRERRNIKRNVRLLLAFALLAVLSVVLWSLPKGAFYLVLLLALASVWVVLSSRKTHL